MTPSAILSSPADRRAREAALLGSRPLEHVVVVGANGTMGYGSGALFTRAVPRVTFLARSREKAQGGLEAAMRQVRSPSLAERVTVGSYDELDAAVAGADLIFEAVTEQLPLKQQFFERIDRARRPGSIVATVTSGLSIEALARGRSEDFRRHFLGLHFFNPPNVIVGTELVPTPDTDPAVVDFVEVFAQKRLQRVMVRVKDRPGFAGNRIGFKVLNEVAQLACEHGVALMEKLIGPTTGRALGPLATIDLVGWDIHRAIVDNVFENAPDEARETLRLPVEMARLMEQGVLGSKCGRGFFKKEGKQRWFLEPRTGEWKEPGSVALPPLPWQEEMKALHALGRHREALACFAAAAGDEARLARRVIAGYLSYSLHRVGEVTESLAGIDAILGYGFNWAPPGVWLDLLGATGAIAMMEEAGVPVPSALREATRAERPERFHQGPAAAAGRWFVAG